MLILWWHVLRVLYVFCRSQVVCRRTLQCTIKDLVSTVSVDFKVDHLIPLPTEGFSREKYLVESDQSLKQNQFVCTFQTDLEKICVTQKIMYTNEKKNLYFLVTYHNQYMSNFVECFVLSIDVIGALYLWDWCTHFQIFCRFYFISLKCH